MIAYVDAPPEIDLHGEHFLLTVTSGGEKVQFMLTAKAFFSLKVVFAGAYAKRQYAELEAREKLIKFPKAKRRKKASGPVFVGPPLAGAPERKY